MYLKALEDGQDILVIWQTSLHLHATGYIVDSLKKKMPDNLSVILPEEDHLQNPGHKFCPHPMTVSVGK